MHKLDPELKRIAESLRSQFGSHVRQILFFGSRVRRDATPESDYDCLLVFDQVTPDLEAQLDEMASRWLIEKGMLLSLLPLNENDLERLRYEPFLQNARREGIAA